VHLVTGSPNPLEPSGGYATLVLRVGADRTVSQVAELTSEKEGTHWIAVSNELRRAVVVPRDPVHTPVRVVDLDLAAVVKSCAVPAVGFAMEQWIWNVPGIGPQYVEHVGNPGGGDQLRGMLLDPAVPCDRSFSKLTPTEAKYLAASGYAGVADVASHDAMRVAIDSNGRVSSLFPSIGRAYFDLEVPSALYTDIQKPIAAIMASNQQLLALGVTESSDSRNQRLLVFRKADQTWHRLPGLSEQLSWTRAFGRFLAVAAAQGKSAKGPDTPGREEWRSESASTGPNLANRLANSDSVFLGRLYLYDADSGQTYSIVTNQGDSEILLVENDVVYYRVSDRLYSAAIAKTALGEAKLLATLDVIRDAHWAFIKRP
jgi:hypothetical protein